MCGVAGILGRVDEANRAAVARMSAAMIHRGPDGHGTWESPPDPRGLGVILAHRRLAILDVSPAGAQPMVDPVTGDVLAYNGELYNYRDLRTSLEREGQTFPSSGDTTVLLRALALRGPEALRTFRGMFAIACWSSGRRQLLLARDPLGMKPLYVARAADPSSGWSVAFASELRALLASGLLGTPRLDPEALASFCWNGFVVGPGTAVRGVSLLEAGRGVVLDAAGAEVRTERFWSIPARQPSPDADEEEVAEALAGSVGLHLASDVPLAVFLSGGVDSSAIANLAHRAARTAIHTFTLAFEEQALNEAPFARRIAEAIGTEHREVLLTESDFLGGLDAALDGLDQPTFDGINAYAMSKAIRAAGFVVALSGAGGDELFGGYSSFRDLPVLARWSRRLRFLPRGALVAAARAATAPLRRAGGAIPPQTRWAKLPAMVARGDDLRALYQLAYALFLPDFQRELVGAGVDAAVDGLPRAMQARLAAETGERSPLSTLSVLEERLFLGERLLRDNDVASMAASVEQRLPLVDSVVFETVDRLPDDKRYLPVRRKALLRRVGLRGLSPELFERPKSGFVLPFDHWIRKGLRTSVDETLRDAGAVRAVGLDPQAVRRLWEAYLAGAPGLYWSRIWGVYVLVRWCHRNRVLA